MEEAVPKAQRIKPLNYDLVYKHQKIPPTTAGVNEGRPLHRSSPIKLNSEDNYERNTDKRRCARYVALS